MQILSVKKKTKLSVSEVDEAKVGNSDADL